jgi:hypothetical protein
LGAPELWDAGLRAKFIGVAHWPDAQFAVGRPVYLGSVVLVTGDDGTLLMSDVRALDNKVFD